ncbi:unnamed protein product [Bursaphelenchus okinawaensis]|uniref:Elongator complex protein 1 n=1 Tax=Bursaphelenchus okinawaensis TaxID=465554 RepID=A0A811JW38_9BILA|nr:unnamed protein product [Bursaphelenchus okinawaensis]CAG9085767.1 unnamed protein product [Bursaphelenchus okinawaensis]
MKNLHLYKVIQTSNPNLKEELKNASHFASDTRAGQIFFITSEKLIGIKNGELSCDYEFDSSVEHEGPVVCFDYLSDSDELFWIYQNGHCYRMNVESWEAVEDTGVVFEPVWGASWSPGYQNLVVATENTLLLFSRDLDVISESEVKPNYAGKEELQTIGWGSKETQFQGSVGKGAREVADKDRQLTLLVEYDQEQFGTLIKWRADGQVLAISNTEVVAGAKCRRVRIWDSDLNFLALCDPLSGIEPTLEVLPSRNLFVTSRTSVDEEKTRSLWFYEQNGQYRKNVTLEKQDNMKLQSIQTNCDGTILALVFDSDTNVDAIAQPGGELQFWTLSNAEWTKKLAYKFNYSIKYSNFSQEFASNFQFLTSEGSTISFDIGFLYNSETGKVVSVNGRELRLTDLNVAPIPPPMSHVQYKLAGAVSSIFIRNDGRIAVLNKDMMLYLVDFKDLKAEVVAEEKLENVGDFVYELRLVDDQKVSYVSLKDGEYKVEVLDLKTMEISSLSTQPEPIVYHKVDGTTTYVITDKGKCLKTTENETAILFDVGLTDFFKWTWIGNDSFLGLSPNFNLYLNDRSIIQNCMSYSINGSLCLFTTFEHKLHVLEVNKDVKKADEGRKVERGAVVVGHEGENGTKCWLQMPRGNLEGIHPRFLTLSNMKTLLNQKQYLEAAIQMRKHRINMNLILDHDPESFYNSLDTFIGQFDPKVTLHMDLLQLFILGLEETDSTATAFKEHYEREGQKVSGKVVKAAEEMEKVIRRRLDELEQGEMLYLCLLSCLIKKEQGNSATNALLDLKERSAKISKEQDRTKHLSMSLRHLSYIVDPNPLFEAALRTFDLNILSMIADKLQKDPKEYIPLINRLKGFEPENYRRFHICLLLEDWAEALDYISKVEEKFDECCEHVKQYGLYSRALRLFKGTERYKEICSLSADHYYKKAKFTDAAYLYQKCDQYEKALQAFESALNVEEYCNLYESFVCQQGQVDATSTTKSSESTTLNIPKAKYELALKKMAVHLEQKGRTAEAATALAKLNFEAHAEKIANLLATAGRWTSLSKLTTKMPEAIVTDILMNKFEAFTVLFENQKQQILEYQERLLELREIKQRHLNAWIEAQGDDAFDCAQSETTSIASSMMSQASRMSTASSRRRKNVDKKKSVVKKGSQYEDAAILLALKSLYKAVDDIQEEMAQFLRALVTVDLLQEAAKVQEAFDSLIKTCTTKRNSIWPEYLKATDLPGPIFETFRCEDGIVRLPEGNSMPPRFQLSEELMAPKIRSSVTWKLDLLQ